MINIACPWCETPMAYEPSAAGQNVECFACSKPFKMPAKPPRPSSAPPPPPASAPARRQVASADKRYHLLEFLAAVYWVAGILVGIGGLACFGLGIMMVANSDQGGPAVLASGIGGLIGGITCMAASEGIGLFIQIEKNTRSRP